MSRRGEGRESGREKHTGRAGVLGGKRCLRAQSLLEQIPLYVVMWREQPRPGKALSG